MTTRRVTTHPIRIDALAVDPEYSGFEALTQYVSARGAVGPVDITVTKLCVGQQNCLTGSLRTPRAPRLLSFQVIGFANGTGGAMAQPIPHAMTTTAVNIEGYHTTKTLGVVRGVTVRSRSVFGTIGASLQTLVGGNITLLTDLCEKTRE